MLPSSRRSFLQGSSMATAALAFRIMTEPLLAGAREIAYPHGAVIIDQNENPLGPCQAAREAIASIIPQGGRYAMNLTDDMADLFARQESLKPEYIKVYPGSSEPLHYSVVTFTSPQKS